MLEEHCERESIFLFIFRSKRREIMRSNANLQFIQGRKELISIRTKGAFNYKNSIHKPVLRRFWTFDCRSIFINHSVKHDIVVVGVMNWGLQFRDSKNGIKIEFKTKKIIYITRNNLCLINYNVICLNKLQYYLLNKLNRPV